MIFLLISQSLSWWGHSHMMIGRIAENMLTSSERKKLEAIISYGALPTQTITEATTWQDDLKDTYDMQAMGIWHFTNRPIIRTEDVHIPPPKFDVLTVLNSSWRALTDKTTTDPWVWAFHIRNLLHFVADVHTPHHNVALYDKDLFPNGDAGGNGYKLNCVYGSACNNIHFLWDSAGLMFNLFNPLYPKYRDEFAENATNIVKDLPESYYSNKDLKSFKPKSWSDESFEVVKTYGYNTTMYGWPQETYFSTVRYQCKLRIVIAGYRLGYILKSLVNDIPISVPNNAREVAIWIVDAILVVFSIILVILLRHKRNSILNQALM